jgi:hypothetical protein
MRQLRPSLLTLALATAAAVALASCGGGDADLLPGDTAREITANLDAVEDLADSGDCAGAQSAAQQVRDQIEALGGVDRQLKQALRDGADRLNEVVENCVETTTEAIAPAVIPNEDTTPESPGKDKRPKNDDGDGDDEDEENDNRDEEAPAPPRERPTTPGPPQEPPPAGGGTGAPGGVAPGAPAGEDGD